MTDKHLLSDRDLLRVAAIASLGQAVAGSLHTLKNDLFAITGTVEIVRRQMRTEPHLARRLEAVEQKGEIAQDSLRLLLDLAADLNDEPTRFALAGACEDAFHLLGHAELPVESSVDSAVRVEAPRAPVVLAILHLLRNAIEAGRGPISLTVRDDDGHPLLIVTNPGTFAFVPTQFRTDKRRSGAAGLGLPFIGALVARIGGDFTIEADEDVVGAYWRFPPLS